ncbi:carbohydrate porin [Cupriavidus necator]|uniref:Carbohydrate porin n=1 Tax=Cupriavidus necator TaxID=106590 RepID=A0A367PMZ2_CUPNE|nr:carbohydrate porin [Cupriavidus necator]QQX84814.1 carbohydrate porin [Cupriavidus necator]RCJ08943.1 carbohydrate porin [Cupriavidus necator]
MLFSPFSAAPRRGPFRFRRALAALACCACLPALAQQAEQEQAAAAAESPFAFHGQSTYIWQRKPAFNVAYSGPNSLGSERAKSYSFSATLDLGVKLWRGAEFHFNPEVTQGVPFSELHGMGGLSNGELAKVSSTNPVFYRARAFVRQTWGLGGGSETLEADFNQFARTVDQQRVVLTAGNFGVLDVFDQNEFGSDPRTQFMNWSFLTHGAFDYPADARGYNWGLSLEYIGDGWSARIGHFLQPLESNGLRLDTRMFEHYGDIIEVEKRYQLAGRPGTARLLWFRNKARMGAFSDAIGFGMANNTTPDVADVRREHAKSGVGVTLVQQVTDSLGMFARASLSDDKTETYAFTEIGRQVSAGGVLKGDAWGRARDALGVAVAINMLGPNHRNYLAAGGQGAFLGDGALRYGPEQILEIYYSFQPVKYLSISPDFQYVRNPGYNRDRGPVKFYGVRFHGEF